MLRRTDAISAERTWSIAGAMAWEKRARHVCVLADTWLFSPPTICISGAENQGPSSRLKMDR
jgi:hypothetical protein